MCSWYWTACLNKAHTFIILKWLVNRTTSRLQLLVCPPSATCWCHGFPCQRLGYRQHGVAQNILCVIIPATHYCKNSGFQERCKLFTLTAVERKYRKIYSMTLLDTQPWDDSLCPVTNKNFVTYEAPEAFCLYTQLLGSKHETYSNMFTSRSVYYSTRRTFVRTVDILKTNTGANFLLCLLGFLKFHGEFLYFPFNKVT